MSNRSPLHITTHEYQDMVGDDEKLELFIYDFFHTASGDTQYAAVKELLLNTFDFSRAHLASSDAACALITLLVDLHELNISKTFISYEELREFAKRRLVEYSLECPPFYTAFFEMDAIKATAEFIDFSYTNNYKLWRYLFCPVPVLEIKAKKTLDLIEIQSLLQLGYPEDEADSVAAETAAATHAADSKTLSSTAKQRSSTEGNKQGAPTSKKGQPVVEAAPEPVLPRRILLPFNSVPLSLTEATLYQAPPPKTEDEIVAEEIRTQIQEAYADKKDDTDNKEEDTKKEEVDVERLAKVIETATSAQLEKARARMIAELESSANTTTTTSGKKESKK